MIDDFDVENDPAHDLFDDHLWRELLDKMKSGYYHGGLSSPPCSTFGCRRNKGGPRPLRDADEPGLRERSDLTAEEKEQVRGGTACTLRSAEASQVWQEDEHWIRRAAAEEIARARELASRP